MPLEISPILESDLPSIVPLGYHAFAANPVFPALFPAGASEAYVEFYTQFYLKDMRTDPTLRFMKCVDTTTNEIISFAEWFILPQRTQEEIEKPPELDFPSDANVELAERLIGQGIRRRHGVMGTQPYAYLAALVTSANHRRRGAGSMLLDWGTELADREGSPCYLEAAPAGVSLYLSKGFVEVGRINIDTRPYVDQDHDHLCMVRQPVGKEGRKKEDVVA